MAFDPQKPNILASGSDDNTIKIWDIESGACQSTLRVDAGYQSVQSVSFSPKDNVIAAGCSNCKIYLVDAVAGEVKSTLKGHTKDNPECTCEFGGYGHFEKSNPECPVTGHTHWVTQVEFIDDKCVLGHSSCSLLRFMRLLAPWLVDS